MSARECIASGYRFEQVSRGEMTEVMVDEAYSIGAQAIINHYDNPMRSDSRLVKCIMRVKVVSIDGTAADVVAMYSSASPVSSMPDTLASRLGIFFLEPIAVAVQAVSSPSPSSINQFEPDISTIGRKPSAPITIECFSCSYEGEGSQMPLEAKPRTVKIAPVIMQNRIYDLVLGRDWFKRVTSGWLPKHVFSPSKSYIADEGTWECLALDWGAPSLGPGYSPYRVGIDMSRIVSDMSHHVTPDSLGQALLDALLV